MWNGLRKKNLAWAKIQIKEKNYDLTAGIQNVSGNSPYNTIKSRSDIDQLASRDMLHTTKKYDREHTKGQISRCDKQIKNDLNKDVRRSLNLGTKHEGNGFEKSIIPSNIYHIFTRLELLLRVKLYGHTDNETEASNLIDDTYIRGATQSEHYYRIAFDKLRIKWRTPKKTGTNCFDTRPKKDGHILIIMDKSIHEEHLSQLL